ncbi:mycothiol conjugate amidase Mca [Zhihengliuella salsuginis]|uniref:mycothiol conjugate amidase Mca n=1 Tax=Zhihengliuella salsuginis TaxID=578222 RepID=UPI00227D84CC|nr:mycothiol conjugate amidase Mca [Zhihengliuella salsuginis]
MDNSRKIPVPNSEGLRLLAVHAHPDDESSKGAATMAAYLGAGARVMVASCTGGERGDILNAAVGELAHAHRDLPGVRRKEMAEAAAAIGVEHRWIGYVDSGLPEGDPLPALPPGSFALQPVERAAAPLVKLIREFKPQVMTTYDENGGYPHPDHIQCHNVSVFAYEAAADPEFRPELGEPWSVSKVYYDRGFSPDKFMTLHRGMLDAGMESPYAERVKFLEENEDHQMFSWVKSHPTTTKVYSGEFFDARDAALKSHRTQIDPDGFFFAVPNEIAALHYPWEDFTLARHRIDGYELADGAPESDLFEGLR